MIGKPQIAYLTTQGKLKYKKELKKLYGYLEKLITRMKALRQRHEVEGNADWEQTQYEVDTLLTRIKDIEEVLRNSKVIKKIKSRSIQLGSSITCRLADKLLRFRLVDTAEANPVEGKISIKSPMGGALLGKRAGDSATITVPAGQLTYRVLSVA